MAIKAKLPSMIKFIQEILGELDDQGFLRVIGRKDEVIALQNGRNISPTWIEDLVMQTLQTEEVFVLKSRKGILYCGANGSNI